MVEFIVEEKLDGISISLEYQDGNFFRMITRGDGLEGEDVTDNAFLISSIPKSIPSKGKTYIRGEMVIRKEDFREFLKPLKKPDGTNRFENERNSAAGLTRTKESEKALVKHLTFVGYSLYGEAREKAEVATQKEVTLLLGKWGFVTPAYSTVTEDVEDVLKIFNKYDTTQRDLLPWKTDGLVLSLNSLDEQERLGYGSDNRPLFAIAIKPTPKMCVTKVLGVNWNQGLSGAFTPVASVEPTALDDVTLRNVNMHNAEFLCDAVDQGFGVGALISVARAGDVIPHFEGVVVPGKR